MPEMGDVGGEFYPLPPSQLPIYLSIYLWYVMPEMGDVGGEVYTTASPGQLPIYLSMVYRA